MDVGSGKTGFRFVAEPLTSPGPLKALTFLFSPLENDLAPNLDRGFEGFADAVLALADSDEDVDETEAADTVLYVEDFGLDASLARKWARAEATEARSVTLEDAGAEVDEDAVAVAEDAEDVEDVAFDDAAADS